MSAFLFLLCRFKVFDIMATEIQKGIITMGYRLIESDIDKASEEICAYLNAHSVNSSRITKTRLAAEEALIRFKEQFGEVPFVLKMGKLFGKISISVSVKGTIFDPFASTEDSDSGSVFMRNALSSAGALPAWKYSRGVNSIVFTIQRRTIPGWTHLIFAVISAVLLWLVMQLFPAEVNIFVHEQVFRPLLSMFLGFLGAVAGPLIFLSIVWGIYSIGDATVFSVLGKRLGLRYIVYIFGLTAALGLAVLPLFSLSHSGAGAGGDYSALFQMILDIVPNNFFTPFSSGNTLQILFLGICIGLAMIFVSEKTQSVAALAEQLNYIVQVIMNVVGKLVPLFIFGSIYDILAGGNLSRLSVSYKMFLCNLGCCAVLFIIYVSIVCARTKVRPAVLLKKALSSIVICVTTASSAAVFGTSLETCRERYGIKDKIVNFGVPFGQVIYKPEVAFMFLSSALCSAEFYGIPVSASWIITALMVCAILAIATPPIPGGATASMAVLFTQLNIPPEALAATLAVAIIVDFFGTATDIFGGQCMLILGAKDFGMLDEDKLRSDNLKE